MYAQTNLPEVAELPHPVMEADRLFFQYTDTGKHPVNIDCTDFGIDMKRRADDLCLGLQRGREVDTARNSPHGRGPALRGQPLWLREIGYLGQGERGKAWTIQGEDGKPNRFRNLLLFGPLLGVLPIPLQQFADGPLSDAGPVVSRQKVVLQRHSAQRVAGTGHRSKGEQGAIRMGLWLFWPSAIQPKSLGRSLDFKTQFDYNIECRYRYS